MPINRLLTEKDRLSLAVLIEKMWESCRDMMARKIIRANVQQAFVIDTILNLTTNGGIEKILSVGCFEDTAFEYLKKSGKNIVGIDPAIDFDLHSYRNNKTVANEFRYDIVFSTSVIEHVEKDNEFLDDMCKLLKDGGYGILTMDFNDGYKEGDSLPYSDLRFYTKKDLTGRFFKILKKNGCELVDTPDWEGEPEFTHDGCNYSFATFVFRKIGNV